ncbi:MAG: hypothetical protein ACR2NH_10295 [Solirubrobacteraceae bacterium]
MAVVRDRGVTDRDAREPGNWTVARVITTIAWAIVAILAIAVILVVLEANPTNGIVEFVLDVGKFFAGPFDNIFSFDNAKTTFAVNYGIAALVYLLVAFLIARLLTSRR